MLYPEIGEEFWGAAVRGEGPLCWAEPGKALYFAAPGDRALSRLFMQHAEGNWAEEGPVLGFNGDLERPSLSPSIHAGDWHGYIVRGELADEPSDEPQDQPGAFTPREEDDMADDQLDPTLAAALAAAEVEEQQDHGDERVGGPAPPADAGADAYAQAAARAAAAQEAARQEQGPTAIQAPARPDADVEWEEFFAVRGPEYSYLGGPDLGCFVSGLVRATRFPRFQDAMDARMVAINLLAADIEGSATRTYAMAPMLVVEHVRWARSDGS